MSKLSQGERAVSPLLNRADLPLRKRSNADFILSSVTWGKYLQVIPRAHDPRDGQRGHRRCGKFVRMALFFSPDQMVMGMLCTQEIIRVSKKTDIRVRMVKMAAGRDPVTRSEAARLGPRSRADLFRRG